MANPVGHSVIPIELKCITGLAQHLGQIMRVKQTLCPAAAQLLGPVAEQRPGRWRGIEKTPVRRMPRDQVGGVLGNQPVQAPGLGGFTPGQQFVTRLPATGHDTLGFRYRYQRPQPQVFGKLRLHLLNRPSLLQTGAYQLIDIARQPLAHLGQWRASQQSRQCRVDR